LSNSAYVRGKGRNRLEAHGLGWAKDQNIVEEADSLLLMQVFPSSIDRQLIGAGSFQVPTCI
jgi:hypothetical protein